VSGQGPHHRVWSKRSEETNWLGQLVARTNSFVELTTGLHYWDADSNEWRDSDPSFELTAEGYAVARHCQHQVIVSPNLNSADGVAVDLQTPDGQRLRSGIVGLNLFDPVSGKSLQVAAVRNVTGTLVSSNEIVWSDAFDGLRADVRVRNERGQFHQDLLLKEKLSAAAVAKLGFNTNTVRLEVWTEFVEAPTPTEQRLSLGTQTNAGPGARMLDPREADPVLKFGNAMEIGAGTAFIEAEPAKTTRVFKEWRQSASRQWLVEAVRYRDLLPLLEALPIKTAALKAAPSNSRLAANDAAPQRARPSRKRASKNVTIAKSDRRAVPASGPRVVWDYAILNGTMTDYTLRGDTTYYVSGTVILNGSTATTIEGGAVVKFAPYNPGVYVQFNGTVRCLTGPYRPAIFTARDDNTVGEVLPSSTGTPSGYYASTALYGPNWPTGDLHDLHIRYASSAITWYYASSRLSDLQLVNCEYGIGRTYCAAPVHNVLLNNVVQAFWGYAVNYDIEHATINQCSELASVYGTYSQGYINLTNCVLANIASWGSYNQLNANYNGRYNTPALSQANDFVAASSPFQSVGAGSHYLADSAGFRDVGTWLIDSDLLLALKTKTTYAPPVQSAPIQFDTTLSPQQVQRDTGQPDLGYQYSPIDVAVNSTVASGVTLTLADGVAVAGFGDHCLNLSAGARLISQGSAANPNRMVYYNLVQEQAIWWGTQPSALIWLNGAGGVLDLGFTEMTVVPTAVCFFGAASPAASLTLTDCQLAGGRIPVSPWGTTTFKNNLFQRVWVGLFTYYSQPHLLDNLFYGGAVTVIGPAPSTHDNAFDRTELSGFSSNPAIHHNAFINTTGFSSTSYGNLTLTSFNYASGPRGRFYQASTSLINAGSQSAADAGLGDYTTQANQTPDSGTVDIGFHYYVGGPPTATPGSAVICRNQAVEITLAGSDPDGDLLSYIIVNQPVHGTLTPPTGASQHRTYTPASGYEGPDSFTFKLNDGFFDSAPATVTIQVGYQPVADSQSGLQTCRNTSVQITLTGSDSCADPLTFIKVTDPDSGTLGPITQDQPDRAFVTYTPSSTPSPGFCGPDSFTFKVNDGVRDSEPATVSINVGDANLVANCQDVMTGKGQAVTITLTGSDACSDTLAFAWVPGSGPNHGSLGAISQQPPDRASVTYTPVDGSYEGTDGFDFTVANCGFVSQRGHVTVNVVPGPTLFTACEPDRIRLHWAVPNWLVSQYGNGFFYDFRIYRCETTSGECTPSVLYVTLTDPSARDYADTAVEQGKTYCYRVTFRHGNSCYPASPPEVYESPFSNNQCNQLCDPPRALVSGNTAYRFVGAPCPIETYDFASGDLVGSFVPDGSASLSIPNGRGIAIYGTEIFYTDLDRLNPSDAIHVAPYGTEGSGGSDIRTLPNPTVPSTGIQDLAFHGGVLYALTGYPDQPLQVFKLNPNSGAPIGDPISIPSPASSESDGFAVLPNGNFLINDGDQEPVYREYNGTSGTLVSGGLLVDLRAFGFPHGTGVDTSPDGQSLFFLGFLSDFASCTLLETDLAGNLNRFQGIGSTPIEDIAAVIP